MQGPDVSDRQITKMEKSFETRECSYCALSSNQSAHLQLVTACMAEAIPSTEGLQWAAGLLQAPKAHTCGDKAAELASKVQSLMRKQAALGRAAAPFQPQVLTSSAPQVSLNFPCPFSYVPSFERLLCLTGLSE